MSLVKEILTPVVAVDSIADQYCDPGRGGDIWIGGWDKGYYRENTTNIDSLNDLTQLCPGKCANKAYVVLDDKDFE
jgi:hypothetical protein